MKRATVTIPDDLEAKLNAHLSCQEAPPSLTVVLQTALREYLQNEELRRRDYRPARKSFRLPVAEKGSGKHDISINHDKYFAESEL